MSSVLTRYPGRAIAVSFGLLLFTLTSLTPLWAQAPAPKEWGHHLALAFTATSRLSPPREQTQRGASYVKRNFEA